MEDDAELPHWSRTYASYAARFKNPYVLQLTPTVQVELLQAPCVSSQHAKEASASADGLCTASTVWDAGIVLAAHVYNYLTARKVEAHQQEQQTKFRVLDLGSGTGIVGLAAAASGACERVVLTDLPSVVPLLQRNAEHNAAAVEATDILPLALAWDDTSALRSVAAHGPFDLILGGDLLYRTQVVEPLLTALHALSGKETAILLAASLGHSPETLKLFAARAAEAGFRAEWLDASAQQQGEAFASAEVRMLRMRRVRQTSDGKKKKKQKHQQGGSGSTSSGKKPRREQDGGSSKPDG